MVCKKSLYCLKNGPCANYQIRKQIWEENIRFRESLRNINQSDHYWSFQITSTEPSDLDEPSFYKKKKGHKFRNCYDCASVTHEYAPDGYNALKPCHCKKSNENPSKPIKSSEIPVIEDSPETKALLVRPSKQVQTQLTAADQRLNSCTAYSKSKKNVSEYCHRYRNSLSSAQITPGTKIKFSSQSTLFQPMKKVSMKRFPSMEIVTKQRDNPYVENKNYTEGRNAVREREKLDKGKGADNGKVKKDLFRNKDIKLPSWLSGTPISRTTREIFKKDKQIPFTSFGCNNSNDLVGTKKTHNVYASTKEIYPNALSAKLQREEMIMNSLRNEKLCRKSLIDDGNLRKVVNHSSLWATEGNAKPKRDKQSTQLKKSKTTF